MLPLPSVSLAPAALRIEAAVGGSATLKYTCGCATVTTDTGTISTRAVTGSSPSAAAGSDTVTEYRPGLAYQSSGVAPVIAFVKPETASEPVAPAGSVAPSACTIVAWSGRAPAAWNSAVGGRRRWLPGVLNVIDFVLALPTVVGARHHEACASRRRATTTSIVWPSCTAWPSSLIVVEATPAGSLALASIVKLWPEVKCWPSMGEAIVIAGPSVSTVNETVFVAVEPSLPWAVTTSVWAPAAEAR